MTDPDTYLVELFADLGDQVIATIEGLARSKARPPMSTEDLLNALRRAGLTDFTRRVAP